MELTGTLVGPYRVQRKIGEGGMGQVFAAIHTRTEQQVALKLLSPKVAQDQQAVRRFLQEGQALAKLAHPGVVRILHCDQLDDGRVFLAMELLQGHSLRAWMQRHQGPAPRDMALAIGRQIAEVMADIHAQKIVHRDLKPENVFLCPDEKIVPGYQIKLLDFGIAKVPPATRSGSLDTQVQTRAQDILGTARYMAPEQCRDPASVTGSVDVYSLGVLLFELLAGRPPFDGSEADLITQHARDEPPLLREFASGIPEGLSAFIASMLAKNPAERPTMLRCRDMLGRPWERALDENPVPGLSPFTEAQAELFFGRKAEIDELLGLLEASRTGPRRWVQLEGLSGVGKSSLVQAGLLPRLKEQLSEEAPPWRIASLRLSHAPLRSLARSLQTAYADTGSPRTAEEIEAALLAGPDALRALVTAHTPPGCRLLLVIEQLEELFTLGDMERQRLDELVSTALADPDCPLRLLTTLRSDFIHRLEELPFLARHLNTAARYSLRPMEAAALAQVIRGMAQRVGLRLSDGLPERMVRDASSEGSQLPLLGHTLRELWALRRGTTLTHELYDELGGVGGALEKQAERLLDSLGPEGRECAKWLILALVQVSHGGLAVRRSRSRQEVIAAAGGGDLVERMLLRLSGMRSGQEASAEQALRLVSVTGGPEPAQQRVDLVHETLLQTVPSISRWLADERVWLERVNELEVTASSWERAGCPPDDLPTGTLLEHYLQSAGFASHRAVPERRVSALALRYLDAAKEFDRRRARIRLAALGASIAAVLAITFSAFLAIQERQRAEATLHEILDITDSVVSDVDWKLSRRAFTLKVRQQLLENLERRLAKLLEQDPDQPEVRLMRIKTWHRMSDLAFHDEKLSVAEEFLTKAKESIEKARREQPDDPGLKFQLGLNLSKWGKVVLALGQVDTARDLFTKALEHFRHLSPKNDPNDRRTRATSSSESAEVELASGQPLIAAPLYDEAIRLLRQNTLDESNDSRRYDESLLAETLGSRATAAHLAGDPTTAKEFFDEALTRGQSVSQAETENTYYRWVLARILVQLAQFQQNLGEHGTAADYYREAQGLGEELLRGEEPNKRYALVLGESLLGGEEVAQSKGDPARATELHNKRCALMKDFLLQDPKDKRFQLSDCP